MCTLICAHTYTHTYNTQAQESAHTEHTHTYMHTHIHAHHARSYYLFPFERAMNRVTYLLHTVGKNIYRIIGKPRSMSKTLITE